MGSGDVGEWFGTYTSLSGAGQVPRMFGQRDEFLPRRLWFSDALFGGCGCAGSLVLRCTIASPFYSDRTSWMVKRSRLKTMWVCTWVLWHAHALPVTSRRGSAANILS